MFSSKGIDTDKPFFPGTFLLPTVEFQMGVDVGLFADTGVDHGEGGKGAK